MRLVMVDWTIANGSDLRQRGDGALMRASLSRSRVMARRVEPWRLDQVRTLGRLRNFTQPF
jgi:hypothetical protein